ncbi:MAG: hypothetical protein ABIR32_03550 [Ilumatobacteraceae bacterium]
MRKFPRLATACAAISLGAGSISACGTGEPSPTIGIDRAPAGLQRIVGNRPAAATEFSEVFVCAAPPDTTDPNFGDLPLRLSLDPAAIAAQMNDNVTPYFEQLSNEHYRPTFVGGQTLTMTKDETHDQCVERAIDASSVDTAVVMVVANAENVAGAAGGWGRPGEPCRFGFCPAAQTRRALFVGASDFHPDWGAIPLLDLIEHEIGHTLDLPHSGDGNLTENQHASALDVMSNSAAPREMAEAANGTPTDRSTERKNGQDTLAIDRLSLGWLPLDDVAIVSEHGGEFNLSPSFDTNGLRMLVLPDEDNGEVFLTVEHLAATGFDDFLPESGLTVHRIDQRPTACDRATTDPSPCTGVSRAQIALGSPDPHTDLLDQVGDSWNLDGWTITVRSTGALLGVEVRPTER